VEAIARTRRLVPAAELSQCRDGRRLIGLNREHARLAALGEASITRHAGANRTEEGVRPPVGPPRSSLPLGRARYDRPHASLTVSSRILPPARAT
jgi:hypothetical protein